MDRMVEPVKRIKAPIIKNGDNIVDIVTETVLKASYRRFQNSRQTLLLLQNPLLHALGKLRRYRCNS